MISLISHKLSAWRFSKELKRNLAARKQLRPELARRRGDHTVTLPLNELETRALPDPSDNAWWEKDDVQGSMRVAAFATVACAILGALAAGGIAWAVFHG